MADGGCGIGSVILLCRCSGKYESIWNVKKKYEDFKISKQSEMNLKEIGNNLKS